MSTSVLALHASTSVEEEVAAIVPLLPFYPSTILPFYPSTLLPCTWAKVAIGEHGGLRSKVSPPLANSHCAPSL